MLLRLFARAAVSSLVACIAMSQLGAQTAPRDSSPPGDASRANASRDESVSGALRRSADRHGLWGSLGFGRGRAGLHCRACTDGTTQAYAIHGTAGIRLRPRVLIGAESFGWLDVFSGDVNKIARGTYGVLRLYAPRARLFLQGGAGVASFRVNDGEVAFATRSPSLALSAGYDWKIGGFSLTPSVTAIASTGGSLKSDRTDNAIADHARLGVLRTSVALSWFR